MYSIFSGHSYTNLTRTLPDNIHVTNKKYNMLIDKNIDGKLNFFTLNNKLSDDQRVELLYFTLVKLYPFNSEEQDLDKYIEFVQSEVRALLTSELT